MKIVFVIAACLAVSLVCLDAHPKPGGEPGGRRGGPGGGRGGGRGKDGRRNGFKFNSTRNGTQYYWTRVSSEGESVNETAFIKNDSKVVIYTSRDPTLETLNFTKAKTIFAFSNGTFVIYVPYKPGAPCILEYSSRTFDAVKADLDRINNTEVTNNKQVFLNATGLPLTEEEANALKDSGVLSFACTRQQVVRASPVDTSVQLPPNSTEISFYSLDGVVKVAFIPRSRSAGPFPVGKGPRRGPGGPRGHGGARGPGGPAP